MSLFRRVIARAAVAGSNSPLGMPNSAPSQGLGGEGRPLAYRAPKVGRPTAQPLSRAEEKDEVAPLRREMAEEEEVAPLRREKAEEEEVAPLRREMAEEEEVAPLRREMAEDGDVQSLRRAEEQEGELQSLRREPDEELQALRREESEDPGAGEELQALHRMEEEETAAPLRRSPAKAVQRAGPETTDPDGSQESPEAQDMPEIPTLQALSRATLPGFPVGDAAGAQFAVADGPQGELTGTDTDGIPTDTTPGSFPSPASTLDAFSPVGGPVENSAVGRPRVTIEQVDVVIHEPSPVAPSRSAASDLSRSLRTKYLGGF